MRSHRRLKILFITNSLSAGGIETYMLNLAKTFRKTMDVSILCYGDINSAGRIGIADIPIFSIKLRKMSNQQFLPRYISKTKKIINKISPSIVYGLNLPSYIIASFASALSSVPLVITQRDIAQVNRDYRYYMPLIKQANKLTDAIIVVSSAVRDLVLKYEKVNPEKVIRLYNSVPVDDIFTRSRCGRLGRRKEFGITPDQMAIGVISRLIPGKGIEYFIRSASHILKSDPSAIFFIIGYGPEEDNLKALARRLKVEDKIIFTGIRRDIPELLGTLDIVVCPSVCGEGLSIAMLEAMAAGKPIVCTDVPSAKEVLTDKKNALFVRQRDVLGLAKATLKLVYDENTRQRIGKAAYRHARRNFAIEKNARQLMQLYYSMLRKKQAG